MAIQSKLIIGLLVLLFALGLAACSSNSSPEGGYESSWSEEPSTNNTGPASSIITSLPTFAKDYKTDLSIGSTGGESSGGNGEIQRPSESEKPKPDNLHFEYFRVYLPWAGVNDGSGNWEYTWVNSTNTNRINQLWRQFINRVAYKDEPFYIRNHRNRNSQARFKDGNDYYLFDSNNLDIWYAGMKDSPLKKFVAGVIIQYRGGSYNGVYTIGGLYRTYAKTNPSGNWGNDGVNMFMGIDIKPMRKPQLNGFKGDLEVIVVNLGKVIVSGGDRANPKPEYAIDIYYSDQQHDKNGNPVYQSWIEDESSYIGQNPRNFYEGKLNRSLLLSEGWYYNKYFWSFVPYWDK